MTMEEKKQQLPGKRKPLFTAVSFACLLPGFTLTFIMSSKIDHGETLAGYSSLGILLSYTVALVLSGLVTGQIGLIRGEKPLALPVLALIINGIMFIAVIVNIPG